MSDIHSTDTRHADLTETTPAEDARTVLLNIDRRSVDRPLTDADTAFRDRTIEAEEHAELAVVGKEARVTEEMESTDRQETISDTVRKTEVEVEDDRKLNDNRRSNDR